MKMFVESVGLIGPGLAGWQAARPILAAAQPYAGGELSLPRLDILPAAERRRTGLPVKLAIAVGQDALAQTERATDDLPTVFSASGGDGEVIHEICETLAGTERLVSPTRFHNSVHNAPAGYWSIATRSQAKSTSLCCRDWSFAAGLLEAATEVATESAAVLLLCYDARYPEPLHRLRPVENAFGAALLLTRRPGTASVCSLSIELTDGQHTESTMDEMELENLRKGNPAARALPLLAAIAAGKPASVILDYLGDSCLRIDLPGG
ncbi:MAG: beta-ketoacyl synthase chain length factor [Burkholderiales bacterium]